MSHLILLRHSLPNISQSTERTQWALSDEGRERAKLLAKQLFYYQPTAVITSMERKAAETGKIVATMLGIPCAPAQDLHEHDRSGVSYASRPDFERQMTEFFAKPDRVVFGTESANDAYRRFARGVDRVLRKHHYEPVVIVTHGTVMSLFIAQNAGIEPLPLWRSLGIPSFAVLSLPGCSLLRLVDAVQA